MSTQTFTVEVYDDSTPTFPGGVPATKTQLATVGNVNAAAVADYASPVCTSSLVAGVTNGFTTVCTPAPGAALALGTNQITCTCTNTNNQSPVSLQFVIDVKVRELLAATC